MNKTIKRAIACSKSGRKKFSSDVTYKRYRNEDHNNFDKEKY